MNDNKRRLFTADARFAVTPAASDQPRTLTGYAMLWNALSTDRGGYVVRLQPNSVRFATPTLALYYHNFEHVIGTTANGSLRLTSDQNGVKFEMDLPDTTLGRDVLALVAGKYLSGMSFAMASAPTGTTTKENGIDVFTVNDFLCDEVSVVVNPAFVDTTVSTAQPTAPAPSGQSGFSDRMRQSLRLDAFRLDQLRLV